MTDFPNFRELCEELIEELEVWIGYGDEADCADAHAVVDRARTALATPPPEPPTIGSAEDAARAIYSEAMTWAAANTPGGAIPPWVEGGNSTAQDVARQVARSLATPPPEPIRPIPVSERLPGPEDCLLNPGATIGSCWIFNPIEVAGGIAWWSFEPLEWSESGTHWLPYNALPLPEVAQ